MRNGFFGPGVRVCAACLGLLCLRAAGGQAKEPHAPPPEVRNMTSFTVRTPEKVVRDWPQRSRLEALALIAKYGEPDIVGDDSLAWVGNLPWNKTVVHRWAPEGVTRLTSDDVVEQSIPYDLPRAKLAVLRRFDRRLTFDDSSGELSSISRSESFNYLALNLAHEILAGKRTPDEAGAFYRRTAELSQAGKSSPYLKGFLFRIDRPRE